MEKEFTKDDLKKAFLDAVQEDWYYVLGDDEQHYRPRYSSFEDWFEKTFENASN